VKKIYISQPMRNLTHKEIMQLREYAIDKAEAILGETVAALQTYDETASTPLEALTKALMQMPKADAVVFVPGYGAFRGCRIEQMMAAEYEKKCIYLKEP
jgi:hypothetical protein